MSVCLAEGILEYSCPVCVELCTETAGVESLVQCIEASGRLAVEDGEFVVVELDGEC